MGKMNNDKGRNGVSDDDKGTDYREVLEKQAELGQTNRVEETFSYAENIDGETSYYRRNPEGKIDEKRQCGEFTVVSGGADAGKMLRTLEKAGETDEKQVPADKMAAVTDETRLSGDGMQVSADDKLMPEFENLSDDPEEWPKGEKTLEDYLAMPDDIRVELVDGVFYNMSAPRTQHALIGGKLYSELDRFVGLNGGKCIPMSAPVDVQLDCDDKTIVQPDLFILCDRKKLNELRVYGSPDMVVEIVSPSNWKMDVIKKKDKYEKAGVREYWMIFPKEQRITVCMFETGEKREYSFADQIPVHVWGGECVIDFARLWEKVMAMYEP